MHICQEATWLLADIVASWQMYRARARERKTGGLELARRMRKARARERKTGGLELARRKKKLEGDQTWENVCFVQGTAWQIEKMEGKVSAWSPLR